MVTAGGLSEAEFNGATLSLQSQTTLSLYFTDTDKLTFSCVDENNDVRTVETKKNGSTQIARIRNIAASELQNSFTVTVKKGESIIYNHLSAAVVNELLGNGGIYYWQKEKAIQLVSARGVQFPKGDIKDGFVKSISDSKSKVKKKYHDVKNTTTLGTVTYSPMNYCCNALNGGTTDEKLINVAKALFWYSKAAKEYFAH